MKVKAIQYYSDTELQRNVNIDEEFQVTAERASYLTNKGFVKIISETPTKKAKTKK